MADPYMLSRRGFVLALSPALHARTADPGFRKYPGNPVLGGALGTCFDVALLRERGVYRMWFSWRPKKSIAVVESDDGIRWSEPEIVLEPNAESGWEDDVNRPVVVNTEIGRAHV